MTNFSDLPQHILVFAAILGMLLLSFLVFYLLPSFVVSLRLSRIIKRLRALNGVPTADMGAVFGKSGVLEHLWREYADSLHHQEAGKDGTVRLRSTQPAGAVFRPEIIVDIPLRTDFFKHLPGLFTGVGIIGTFYGLLLGLKAFNVSENPVVVRNSLTNLLHGVSEAFLISASAITLAMIITFIEKLVITRLNARVERLSQLLDSLFEGGAGEEYLARLVRASENASAQTAGLLKGDLAALLGELTERQIAANQAGLAQLGEQISGQIERTLAEPLNRIAQSIGGVRDDQQSAVQTMLTGVLDSFSKQLKDLFGSQITGINSLQQQTLEALQAAVSTLQKMASDVDSAGQRSTQAIAEQLAQSMAAAEANQRIMADRLHEFVDQMRAAVSNSEGEIQNKLQQTLEELSQRMGVVIDELTRQVRAATEHSQQQQAQLANQSREAVSQFGGQVGTVVEGVNRAVAEMKAAVLVMRNLTTESMTKMNSGADTLYLAAKDFAKAGQGVTSTLDKSAAVATQLTQAAGSVASASNGLGGVLADYKAARDSMVELVGSLKVLIEQARRDASMTGDVVARIEASTVKLVAAQKETEQYLSRVSDVIGKAHGAFSDGMVKAVGEANREFHLALSDSVKLLREGIQELENTLDAAVG